MSADLLNYVLLGSMLVLLAGVLAVRLATRAGLPALLAFLGLGLALGEGGLGIRFDDPELMQVLGFTALAIILAEGGLSTKWSDIRPALPFALLLSTVGVGVSVTVTAIVGHYALGLDWRIAILVGAVVSSTDAAAVFSILRYLPLRARVRSALEAESGLNDPPVVILVTLVVSDIWAQTGILAAAGEALYQLIGGAVLGIIVGITGQWLLNRSALPTSGLYPAATCGLPLLAFGGSGVLGASGFLAAYVCGLWLGNAPLPHRNATLGFAEGVAWLAQIALFTLLGMLASPSELPGALVPALVIGAALTLLARPASVMVSAVSLRMTHLRLPGLRGRPPSRIPVCRPCWRVPLREQAFLSWAGLRGAVPIVLATIPQSEDVAGAAGLFDIVFVLVVIFTLLQGPTLPWIARRLGVSDEGSTQEVNVDSAPIEERQADLLTVNVSRRCDLAGRRVQDLGLPPGALVTLLVRDEISHVPSGETELAPGDRIMVITTHTVLPQVEERLRDLTDPDKEPWH
ncbi:potassium/proton antiporter [Lipingzhangella sp. LS1_29]|uniref:Potassium/proton antiporter n=1 Tax=Lipingzhangella rawalii TaxID=2055835 RepID=A0ABU2H9G6_9ACTN|nr:potassium/proton antiporter [Lipingzhangella rawalii]MDS1271942.1 potassium/proton antiporter [Lipingzhangella rawalii]